MRTRAPATEYVRFLHTSSATPFFLGVIRVRWYYGESSYASQEEIPWNVEAKRALTPAEGVGGEASAQARQAGAELELAAGRAQVAAQGGGGGGAQGEGVGAEELKESW